MSKQKILITWPLKTDRFKQYEEEFQIDMLESSENRRGQVIARISQYDGVLNMNLKADDELFQLAKNLKIMSNYGVGYDHIDTAAAKKHGIAVANTPDSTTNPTANHALGLMLSLMRRIAEHDRRLKSGNIKNWHSGKEFGVSPEGKRLGIIGMGRIGKAFAKRARALDMDIVYHNRNKLSDAEESQYSASYLPLHQLLKSSDVISIHTPLTDSTRQLLGSAELKMMKPTAFLINTARGGVVHELALIKCLTEKSIAGAALDVFENEPNINEAFLNLNNVIITPHSGTATREARNAMMDEAMGNIVAFLKGEEMTSRIV